MSQLPPIQDYDLVGMARKVIQRMDRRLPPRETGQTLTRIATQVNDNLVNNAYRIINIKSSGAQIVDDSDSFRNNLHIPCGYLYCVIDGGGLPVVAGSRPMTSIHVHDKLRVVQWTLIADVSGSITIDLKKSSYASYPSTATIIAGTHPNLTSSQKNKSTDYIDPTTGLVNLAWTSLGWTVLDIGDVLDILVTASTTVTRVTLILQCQAVP